MDASEVRGLIDERYGRDYGAAGAANFCEHLACGARTALGFRRADGASLYLEHYLDVPVEAAVSRAFARPVDRAAIVEIGNLIAGGAFEMIALWDTAANDLGGASEVAVATLSRPLRRMFRRIGIPFHELARADAARLGAKAAKWGSYYAQDPRVCAGEIAAGQRAINAFTARRATRSAA